MGGILTSMGDTERLLKIWCWLREPKLRNLADPSSVSEEKRDFQLFLVLLSVGGIALFLAIVTILLARLALYFPNWLGMFWKWALGLIYVTLGGHIGTGLFINTLRDYMRLTEPPEKAGEKGVPAPVVGIIERLIFTMGLALYSPENQHVIVAMAGWVTLKMAANWNRALPLTGAAQESEENAFAYVRSRTRGAIRALTADVVSLAHAFVAARIVADHLF